ncbi:MAG: diguanylate cyclase [Candidatus Magnetominusculus sp. LBB02]|nr:diguanylate cyclase [Candidatus Magnetominusculus sp. LBB02]
MARNKVMIVEDEGLTAAYIQDIVEGLGYVVVAHEYSGEDAVESAVKHAPDLILMDIKLQGRMDGIEASHEIRKRMSVPIVYLTAHSDKAILERAKVSQPYGYVLKPFNSKELQSNIEMALYKHHAERIMKGSVFVDPTTGLPNRDLFFDRFEQALKYAKRGGLSMAVLIIDLRDFGGINEAMGREVGDKLLADVAGRLSACVKDTDTVARLGEDEFIILLTDIENALDACEAATKVVLSVGNPFFVNDTNCSLGVCIGISLYPMDGDSFRTLIKEADVAMYRAKEAGKNQIRFFNETCEDMNKNDIDFFVNKACGFLIARKGIWDNDGWLDLVIDIKQHGVQHSNEIIQYVGVLLETIKKIYVLQLPVTVNVEILIPSICREILGLIIEKEGVWKQDDWRGLLDKIKGHGFDLTVDGADHIIRDLLGAVNALYVLLTMKCEHGANKS